MTMEMTHAAIGLSTKKRANTENPHSGGGKTVVLTRSVRELPQAEREDYD
jgi:hypothetical protein